MRSRHEKWPAMVRKWPPWMCGSDNRIWSSNWNGFESERGPYYYPTGTTVITQDCPRQKYSYCDLRFINQARPRTNGKEEVTDNIRGTNSSVGHKVCSWDDYLVRVLACHIVISLTSIILWLQRQVLTCPVSCWRLNMLRIGKNFRVNGGRAWAWPFSPILVGYGISQWQVWCKMDLHF